MLYILKLYSAICQPNSIKLKKKKNPSMNMLNNRLNIGEERTVEIEIRSEEIIQNKGQKDKKMDNT